MLGRNIVFPILNENGTSFHGLVLHKATVDSVVMSLGDKITGDVYYKDNTLRVTMHEYIEYKENIDDENEEPVKYVLVNPPTVVREGMVKDNSDMRGMTKYSFEFYHPMYQLSNIPFTDIAVNVGEEKYLSQNKNFSWIGYPDDYIAKLNKNLEYTEWVVVKSPRFPQEKETILSEVLTFSDNTIADALKTAYDTWNVPYVISQIKSNEQYYNDGKRFLITFGLPSNEIYETENDRNNNNPYVFKMGKGVGLKNNSRTPRKNKIITRIAGYGSDNNIPYGYPQIVWQGDPSATQTQDGYPIYKGIVGGAYVNLIKHPFTRTHLMPSIYSETVNKKVNPYASGYDPTIEIKDYYDATGSSYPNPINTLAPSYEIHEFEDIKPELGEETINGAQPINNDRTIATDWDDSINDNGDYVQGYFQITLPTLSFDIYACAAITQEMQINMRSGACIGCTFTVQVDWDDYRANFYTQDGEFAPYGEQRDYTKYPNSATTSITLILQKDTQTFGTLMPNVYQKPLQGDVFVVLGISLPTSYITNAETRLDNAMLSYMLENNIHYYDYPLKFDEYFLATHTNILEQIHPNSIIHFEYGGEELELFVKQMTIKYGQNVLPQYDITLTDNVEVVLNQIGQVADSVEHLSTLISILRQGYSQNLFLELAKKLSKTGDDTASGFITFMKGLRAKGLAYLEQGAQFGSNYYIDSNGDSVLNGLDVNDIASAEGLSSPQGTITAKKTYTDILYAKAAHFAELIIDELRSAGGAYLLSAADCTIDDVEKLNANKRVITSGTVSYYRCYYKANDGERAIPQKFRPQDQVMHTSFDSADAGANYGISNRYYWIVVSSVSTGVEPRTLSDGQQYPCHYIDLDVRSSSTKSSTSNANPEVGDDIVLLGNRYGTSNDYPERKSAILITAYGNAFDAEVQPPAIVFYQDVNSFTLSGKKPNYWGRDKVVITGQLNYKSNSSSSAQDVVDMIGDASVTIYSLELSRNVVKTDGNGATDEHVYVRVRKTTGTTSSYVEDENFNIVISWSGSSSTTETMTKNGYRVNINPTNIITTSTNGANTDATHGISSTVSGTNLFANGNTITITLNDSNNNVIATQSVTQVMDASETDKYQFWLEKPYQQWSGSGTLTYVVKMMKNGVIETDETVVKNYVSVGSATNCTIQESSTQAAFIVTPNNGATSGSAMISCHTSGSTNTSSNRWGYLSASFGLSSTAPDQFIFSLEQDTKTVAASKDGSNISLSPSLLLYTLNLSINGESVSSSSIASYISLDVNSSDYANNCRARISASNGIITLDKLGEVDKTNNNNASKSKGGSVVINCYYDTTTHNATTFWGTLTAKYNVETSEYTLSIVGDQLVGTSTSMTINDLANTVGTHGTQISQNSESISAIAGNVDTTQVNLASLKIQSDKVSASVASQKYNSNLFGFTNGLSFTDTCVPFIQAYGVEFAGTGTGTISGFGGVSTDAVTVSGLVRSMGGNTTATAYVNGTTAATIDVTTSWEEFQFTFTGTTNTPLTALNSISLRYTTSAVDTIAVKNLKVETGVVATAFCISDKDGEGIENVNMYTTLNTLTGDPIYNQINSNEVLDTSNVDGHGNVMRFYRNNSSQSFMIFNGYNWGVDPYTKVLTAGKVYTISFWAKSAQDGLKIHTGFYGYVTASGSTSGADYNKLNSSAVYTDKGTDAIYDNAGGECIQTLTTSWKRYYARFYVMTGITCVPIIQCNNGLSLGTPTSKYIYIADLRLEEGYIADESDPMSISGAQTRSEARFNMTADEIELKLNNTGIDIENKKITLDAENTIVTGSFAAKKVSTSDAGVGHITMENGVMQVFNSTNILQITFGMDSSGNILLRYYNQDGTIAWDLGPTGIQMSASQDEKVSTLNFCMMKTWSGSQWVQVSLDADASVFDLDNYKYRDNGSTESYLRHLLRQTYLPMDGVVYFYNAKINAGQYVGGEGTRALNNEQAKCFDNHFIKAIPTTSDQLSGGTWDSAKGIGDISSAGRWRSHFIYVTHVETLLSANINDVTVINGKYYAIPNGFNPRYNSEDIFEVTYDPNEITQYYKRQLAEFTTSAVEDGLYVDRYVEYYIPLDEIE